MAEIKKNTRPIVQFCDPKFDVLQKNRVSNKYIILSSQRTGSTYVANRLCNIKDEFGLPTEYLNPHAINALLPRLAEHLKHTNELKEKFNLNDYIKFLEMIRTTSDGYFGIKAQPLQIFNIFKRKNVLAQKFISSFDFIVVMTRGNKLEQAISNSIAQIKDRWHFLDEETIFSAEEKKKAYQIISSDIPRYFNEEAFLLDVLAKSKKPSLHIKYEDLESNPEIAFQKILDFLAQKENKKINEEETLIDVPKKNPGQLSKELKENYIKYISGTLS